MSRLFYHVCQDNLGNLLFDVSGTMRLAGSGTLATIYGDEALTVILPNPMTNHPSFGSFKCYLGASAAGYDFYLSKAGYTFETLTGLQGLGTMAQQDAASVAITGGSAVLSTLTPGYPLDVTGNVRLNGRISVGPGAAPNHTLELRYDRSTYIGLNITPTADSGPGSAVVFVNAAGTPVGSIATTSSATSYNTTSDARLKHAIAPLTGALGLVQALKPVSFTWRADDSAGVGFLAGEVQAVIPDGVITGEKDAVEEDGTVRPQMIDMSKLVPYLTAALQDTLAQIQGLQARVGIMEAHISDLQAQLGL